MPGLQRCPLGASSAVRLLVLAQGTLILRRLRHPQRALRRAIWVIIMEHREIVPFVSRTFERGVIIATFLLF